MSVVPSTDTQPDGREVDAAVSVLGALADARTPELDAARRLPDDLHRRAVRSGLFRQLVGSDLGGLGLSPLAWFRNGVALARHQGSLAWVVTQGAAELGWIAAGGDDAWAREVLAEPHATSASTVAGVGSLRIQGATSRFSGRWAFNTGSPAATWIGGLALVEGEADPTGRPVTRWGWVPAGRAEVIEDWDGDGLRGTGSHSTVIPAQDIPTAWTFSPEAPTTNDRGPYRILVGNGNWPIATAVAATQLGNARRALDEATQVVLTKAPAPTFKPLIRNAAVQRALAAAEALWSAASASVEQELEALWDEARRDGELGPARRVALHRANLAASRLAVRAVDLATDLAGTTAAARGHVLSRCRRDAHVLQAHISVNGAAAELNTRVAQGLTDSHVLV